jgi:hypothetical protein
VYTNGLNHMPELIGSALSERGPLRADGFFGLSYENESRKRLFSTNVSMRLQAKLWL